MGLIPNFEEDIFISYAHIDNQPLAEGLRGWVETLHERLKTRLEQLLGDKVNVWRDPKLQGNDIFGDILIERLSKVAILVSVLSPRYIKSEWCVRELSRFSDYAATAGGVRIGNKSRVFKVVKTYIPLQDHPADLQSMLGYEFYEYDQARGRAKEFSPDVTPNRDIRYWEKLEDLAQDIKELIDALSAQLVPETPVPSSGTTTYLAETTSDLSKERDKIKRELQQHGHLVLPDKELPLKASAMKEMVREYLQRSKLSIHLIGGHYGIIPEEESRSIVEIQNELAAERNGDFFRLIWMPMGLEAQEERQKKFIDELKLGLSIQKGTELIQTKLEDLNTQIYEKLRNKPKPAPDTNGHNRPSSIYLICDQQDFDVVAPLEDFLFNRGLEVILPAGKGDESQVIQYHKENLRDSDAVLIYYGQANEIWLRMQVRELQKAPGYGRSNPFLAKGIFIAGPRTDNKERFKTHEALIMRNYEAFSPESLEPFLEHMEKARGVQR